jgi:hypothetical protein
MRTLLTYEGPCDDTHVVDFGQVNIIGSERNPMTSSSHSYESMVLSHLDKVEHLPPEVQVDIAKRVGTYLDLASAAKTDDLLAALAAGAMQEQAKAISQGTISTMDPQWAGPALAEAWCYATISLSDGNLDRSSAAAIITAIENFVARQRVGSGPARSSPRSAQAEASALPADLMSSPKP